MKKLVTIFVFCLFNLVSYSQVIHPLNWGMTQEEVTTAMNNCHLDSLDNNSLITYDIVSYGNFQIDYVSSLILPFPNSKLCTSISFLNY